MQGGAGPCSAEDIRSPLPFPLPSKGGYVPTFGAQAFPPEEKDNTMLYVGGAVAVVAVLALMRRK